MAKKGAGLLFQVIADEARQSHNVKQEKRKIGDSLTFQRGLSPVSEISDVKTRSLNSLSSVGNRKVYFASASFFLIFVLLS